MTTHTAVSVNNGPMQPCNLDIRTETIDITSWGPRPDPDWSFVDAAGHFHAYDQTKGTTNPYPTLVEKSEYHEYETEEDEDAAEGDDESDDDDDDWDWDDDEPGWTEVWHECALCGERIEPGKITTAWQESAPAYMSWSVDVQATEPLPVGEKVSVRITSGDHQAFGIALVTTEHLTPFPDSWRRFTLIGVSPLGSRKTRP